MHVKSPVEVHKLVAGTFCDIENDVKNDNKAKKMESDAYRVTAVIYTDYKDNDDNRERMELQDFFLFFLSLVIVMLLKVLFHALALLRRSRRP